MVETTSNALKQMQSLNTELADLKKKSDVLKTEIQQKKLEKAEQERRKKEIDDQVATIQEKLKAIEAQTEEEKSYKEQLSMELTSIKSSLADLASEVVSGGNAVVQTDTPEKKKDERGIFEKMGDNIKLLWNDGRGSRLKLGAAVGAVGYGIVKTFKSIF
ncbi:MAG: hypothetical protein LBD11_06065 [Candidatus Peribacteria bacterium]|nr:hypothetical protein [Candidatus Peribacteria bacterium]